MKTTITQLSKILSLSALTFIVACTQGNQALQKPKGAPTAPSAAPQPAPSKALGTTDGGGGNAINGKMLESYIIHPEELSAVKNKLADIIKGAFSDPEDVDTKANKNGNIIFKLKTWYLVPMNLNQVNKKALGIEFTEDQTEQVAIQTKDEIWINSQIFEKMSEEEQAKLILHEAVMNYYLLKFQKLSEMCGQIRKVGGDCGGNVDPAELDEYYKPEPERALNAQDYSSIRFVTRWLWENGSNVKQDKFQEVAYRYGFDKRFAPPVGDGSATTRLSKAEILPMIEAAKYGGKLRQKCTAPDLNSSFNCELDFKVLVEEKHGTSFTTIELTLKDIDRGAIIAQGRRLIYDYIEIYSSNSGATIYYNLGFFPDNLIFADDGKEVKPGSMGYYFDLAFNANLSELLGVAVIPLVALSSSNVVEERVESGVKEKYLCKIKPLSIVKGEQLSENQIYIGGTEYIEVVRPRYKINAFKWSNRVTHDCKKIEN